MHVCRAAQASSSEHLRTTQNTEQTAQVKDLSMFLSNGDFFIKLNNTKRHFKTAQVTTAFSKGAFLCRVTKNEHPFECSESLYAVCCDIDCATYNNCFLLFFF